MTYAGDVSPREAWEMLESAEDAILVDVRTVPEWQFVGVPDLAALGRQASLVSWQVWPGMGINPDFIDEVTASSRGGPLLFICRSGVRSAHAAAAATERGLGPCYNVAQGFEGDKDGEGHRGRAGGWKAAGLPWKQE